MLLLQSYLRLIHEINSSNVIIKLFRFGLITPTYNSQKDYTVIKLHIDRYATMECPEMEEIVIVWNNQEDPKDAGFKQLN